eukprot:TRINITY_DN1616_c0_g1_i1.p1 TRINITY_DN1616_c0_g1~~TRINITY_DN1616_c0_g1_i1.p1  ORF type:complete len:552 (-),score=106.20 TRINITY_DN1616_c0_g1_i1:106-1665(-)
MNREDNDKPQIEDDRNQKRVKKEVSFALQRSDTTNIVEASLAFEDDEHERSMTRSLKKQQSYIVLEENELLTESMKQVDYICELFEFNQTTASSLLRHFKWNKERLIERLMEDQDRVFKEAGVFPSAPSSSSSSSQTTAACLVCCDDYPINETISLSCAHRYCLDCWKNYLSLKVQDEGSHCVWTKCPSPGCNVLVDETVFKKVLDPVAFGRYSAFLVKTFVDNNPHAVWCPAPGCLNSVKAERRTRLEPVTCKCGLTFCFQCSKPDHSPATCEQVTKWEEKTSSEAENVNWLTANTKKCPKCKQSIEKNGGCQHMTHRLPGGCGHEFCWICRADWMGHNSSECAKRAEQYKEDEIKASEAKTELDRFLSCYHRFESHKTSLGYAKTQLSNCPQLALDLQKEFGLLPEACGFLQNTAEQLKTNHRALMWSYVCTYYASDPNSSAPSPVEKNLLFHLQEKLQEHTDRLTELWEHPNIKFQDYHQVMDWREKVMKFTKVASHYLQNFVQDVGQGLTADLKS